MSAGPASTSMVFVVWFAEIIYDQPSLLTREADPVGSNQVGLVIHFETVKNTGRAIF